MKITDNGYIIAVRNFSEKDGLVTLITENNGLFTAIFKNHKSKSNNQIVQIGNYVKFDWQARLENHLGKFQFDLINNNSFKLISDKLKLYTINSYASLLLTALPEKMHFFNIYEYFEILLYANNKYDLLTNYLKAELNYLEAAGYGLNLTECAATKQTTDLCYVSPKSGRAVSFEAGKEYADKLIKLPNFIIANVNFSDLAQLLSGLNLTGYFLNRYIFIDKTNQPRNLLISILNEYFKT